MPSFRMLLALAVVTFAPMTTASAGSAPSNDDRADAIQVTTLGFAEEQDWHGVTLEPGEATQCSDELPLEPYKTWSEQGTDSYGSMWYRFTAPATGPVRIAEYRTSGIARIALYEPGSWEPFACEREGWWDVADLIVRMEQGETIDIQVVGDVGTFHWGAIGVHEAEAGLSSISALEVAETTSTNPTGLITDPGSYEVTVTFDIGYVGVGVSAEYQVAACAVSDPDDCAIIADEWEYELNFFGRRTVTRTFPVVLPGLGDMIFCAWIDPGQTAEVDPTDNLMTTEVSVIAEGAGVGVTPFGDGDCTHIAD